MKETRKQNQSRNSKNKKQKPFWIYRLKGEKTFRKKERKQK